MTLTDLLIPSCRNMLRTLRGLLDKAEAQLGADKAKGVAVRPPVSPTCSRLGGISAQLRPSLTALKTAA